MGDLSTAVISKQVTSSNLFTFVRLTYRESNFRTPSTSTQLSELTTQNLMVSKRTL